MNDPLIFRPYQSSDRPALTQIIRESWHYDRFASAKTAQRMARLFLDSCLANQTFTCVAERNRQPIGVIMVKNRHAHCCPLKYRLRFAASLAALLLTVEGRNILEMFRGIQAVDKTLLAESGQEYDGELAFFAIDKKSRGLGLGRQLFDRALREMRLDGLHNFYLFTDTSCNWQFYEHLGLTRRAERSQTLNVDGDRVEMTFFIYDYQL